MKALGMYIFGGSQTIGHLNTGWEIDKVLEMTDDMKEMNSYHFVRNYPNIEIVLPSTWNNKEYLESLKSEQYDLLFANNPCSGLSAINRNASVDAGANVHFDEVVNVILAVEPKVFLCENAPTLTKLGLPILKNIQKQVGDKYKLLVINDCAGNHGVCMKRRRTLVIGWRKDLFGIPMIQQIKKPLTTVNDILSNMSPELPNMEFEKTAKDLNLTRFYHMVPEMSTIQQTLADNLDDIRSQLTDDELKKVEHFALRYHAKDSVWDKSSFRLKGDGLAPSMASVIQFMHPVENRDLYIREYARIMGYPDDFIFYDGCKCSTIQCLAQGVPVKFIEYISKEIMNAFKGHYYEDISSDVVYINQCSGVQRITEYTLSEFANCKKIGEKKLDEVELF